MADSIFNLSARDRAAFFQAAAAKVGRSVVLLEKDVWVVWALRTLYEAPIGEHLVFKGGTSLSKAHRLIERFSEDLDLTYDIRELAGDLLPAGWEDMDEPLPKTPSQANKISQEVRNKRLPNWVRETAAPVMEAGLKKDRAKAKIEIDGCNLSIRYSKDDHGHVKSAVLLEFGARSTGEPADMHDIAGQVADHKGVFFRVKDAGGDWIDYQAAVTGGLQLVPTGDHLAELEADYVVMRDDGLLPEDALDFAQLISRCGEIEAKINVATRQRQT